MCPLTSLPILVQLAAAGADETTRSRLGRISIAGVLLWPAFGFNLIYTLSVVSVMTVISLFTQYFQFRQPRTTPVSTPGSAPFSTAGSSAAPFSTAGSGAAPFSTAGSGAAPFSTAGSGAAPFSTAGSGAAPFGTARSGAAPFSTAGSGAAPFRTAGSSSLADQTGRGSPYSGIPSGTGSNHYAASSSDVAHWSLQIMFHCTPCASGFKFLKVMDFQSAHPVSFHGCAPAHIHL